MGDVTKSSVHKCQVTLNDLFVQRKGKIDNSLVELAKVNTREQNGRVFLFQELTIFHSELKLFGQCEQVLENFFPFLFFFFFFTVTLSPSVPYTLLCLAEAKQIMKSQS